MAPSPLLLALPHGLHVGGVTTFAVRLANGLAARGRAVAVVLHPEARGQGALEVRWHPGVEVVRAAGRFEDSPGDLSGLVTTYRDLVRRMAGESGGPVVVAPQGLGDCYGVAAALCVADPELVRVVGWQHSDIEYDTRVLERYEPVIARFVGVSEVIARTLRERMPVRAGDVVDVAYGVEVAPGFNEPGASATGLFSTGVERAAEHVAGRPGRSRSGLVKLVYTGRLEHPQKRVLALVHLSEELDRRAVPHTLTVVGDGPAAAEFDAAARGRGAIRRVGALPAVEVARVLEESDALVLPSRYEGLSVSMLEAMASGCVPILARTRSGAGQAVEAGYNGEIAEVAYEADERETGVAMAEAVVRFRGRDRAAMVEAAWKTVREKFSIQRHVERVAAMIDEAARGPGRAWPADRACAFTVRGGTGEAPVSARGSGSVPPDGAARLRAVLERLAQRKIVIHGTGQHTVQLAPVLAASPANIVALADDDRGRHGERLFGWPIIAPSEAARAGATDVVISSWMHEEAIWGRRAMYEKQALGVHRVYGAGGTMPA